MLNANDANVFHDALMSLTDEIKSEEIPDPADLDCGFFRYKKEMHVLLKNHATGHSIILPASAIVQLAAKFHELSNGEQDPHSRYYH